MVTSTLPCRWGMALQPGSNVPPSWSPMTASCFPPSPPGPPDATGDGSPSSARWRARPASKPPGSVPASGCFLSPWGIRNISLPMPRGVPIKPTHLSANHSPPETTRRVGLRGAPSALGCPCVPGGRQSLLEWVGPPALATRSSLPYQRPPPSSSPSQRAP